MQSSALPKLTVSELILDREVVKKFFKIISVIDYGSSARYANAASLEVENYLEYLRYQLTQHPQKKSMIYLKSYLTHFLIRYMSYLDDEADIKVLRAINNDIAQDGESVKKVFQGEDVEEVIDELRTLNQEMQCYVYVNKNIPLPQAGLSEKDRWAIQNTFTILKDLKERQIPLYVEEEKASEQGDWKKLSRSSHALFKSSETDTHAIVTSDFILKLAKRLNVYPAWLQRCKESSSEDDRFNRLLLLASHIESGKISVVDALKISRRSMKWLELVVPEHPTYKEHLFEAINEPIKFYKCLSYSITNLQKLMQLFPEKSETIWSLLAVSLKNFTAHNPHTFFDLVDLFPEQKRSLARHFTKPAHFGEYTKTDPVNVISEALTTFPKYADLIFRNIMETTESFLHCIKDISALTWLVRTFPSRSDEIFQTIISDQCFKQFYHYGRFAELNELRTLFASHERELMYKSRHCVPHVQSIESLQSLKLRH